MKHMIHAFVVSLSISSLGCAQEELFDYFDNYKKYYVGMNPVSVAASFQLADNVKRYIPEVSGLEYGFSLVCGTHFRYDHALEYRMAVGNIHQISRVTQFHLGTNYFMLKKLRSWPRHFYIGAFMKFWDYHNRMTKVHFYNVSPYVVFGYTFDMKRILLDIRLNQTIAVHSWSSLEHSAPASDWFFSPWPEFFKVMPSLSFTVAYAFNLPKFP
jgi:hypothetical protein